VPVPPDPVTEVGWAASVPGGSDGLAEEVPLAAALGDEGEAEADGLLEAVGRVEARVPDEAVPVEPGVLLLVPDDVLLPPVEVPPPDVVPPVLFGELVVVRGDEVGVGLDVVGLGVDVAVGAGGAVRG
jgi:hypothetical protein